MAGSSESAAIANDQNERTFEQLRPHDAARAIDHMHSANAGHDQLHRGNEGGKLQQADRAQCKEMADTKDELRMPLIVETV